MPTNRSSKDGPWGRLKPVRQDVLETFGLPSKGDTRLLDYKNQEFLYTEIVDRYMKFCSDAGHGVELLRRFSSLRIDRSTSNQSPPITDVGKVTKTPASKTMTEAAASAKHLSNILSALRKLREGIVASKRVDDFAVQAYLFCTRVSILAKQPESYHPAILHLLRVLHVKHPLTSSELEEIAGYLVLDTACRRKQMADAITLSRQYGVQNADVQITLFAVIHDNYVLFRKAMSRTDTYKAQLMAWADNDMRIHALKCLGRTYHSVTLRFLESMTASKWADLISRDGVGWEREDERVVIRKAKSR
ncbi:hypothetical protein AAL_04444 [Moelleriella libera RCEF 2490]|uniref:Uncharacterized protein n=1 Tax=Moelleriella libera RCEF 2490 TaxID=1081109 RepID=A0A168C502_9HYPO|nr:hypothetical protein AAL_04444 [Moelleriella libera RCEF 2490]